MRILIDTHIALWVVTNDRRLPAEARHMLQKEAGEDVFYSVATLWEVAIKFGLGRLVISPRELGEALDRSGLQRLSVDLEHVARVAALSNHHRDPFDRMLVAQAEVEPLILLTADRKLSAYGSFVKAV